ncbi:transmembrane amino acid transporter protein-domain-containing protein [Aspergillus caelatus]|uniref:Transmembrane amino acid transporter protein-domain-containing protein n=2 Tax=Aspergillus subgen. Circumdati TaxID=2720871 RepID=A0A5N7ABF9_9EURO|nr:transmembrane amino acid transporter protein-domain-containing protein [Aspergillus caelatus]KAE8367055.1 transmembrane amino acid transporter protein-domain-containing protein [Aspergillus caelatus]KAE8421274.1 transmembrane amino acid transporter protein-domain-containing protein [Aspergillus pseudocaelatus]
MLKTKEDPNELAPVPSQAGEVRDVPTYVTDDVFGEVTENGPNYRNVGWIGTVALMMKSQIGLGVLSIPTAFDTLGIVPGIVCLLAIAVITTWSNYMIGAFKLRHRSVFSIDDVDWIFVSGSGMLSLSIGLNAVSTHGVCTAVFVAVAAILGFMFSSIRTLGHITWLAWIGLVCILTAILMVTIAVGVEERPASAPKDGVWVSDFKIVNNPGFSEGITAVSSLVFAYSGTPGFFNIVSEMRDPRHYTRSLLICQAGVTAVYITIGCVVYYYCGSYVASPALGSAGPTMKKISYGFALPGLLVTTTLVTHIPAKYIFIRILRGSRHLTANSLIHWGTWLGCTFGITLIAYVIASAIPVFNSLVSLIGALLGTLMSFQPMGCMWLYDNWSKGKQERSPRWMFMVCWSVFVVVIGTFLMVAGTYGCIVSVIDTYNASGGSAAWSCADNSNST